MQKQICEIKILYYYLEDRSRIADKDNCSPGKEMVSQAKSSASKLCFLSKDFNGVALFEFVFSSSSGMSSNSPLVIDGSVTDQNQFWFLSYSLKDNAPNYLVWCVIQKRSAPKT